jgi:hypothetical protein
VFKPSERGLCFLKVIGISRAHPTRREVVIDAAMTAWGRAAYLNSYISPAVLSWRGPALVAAGNFCVPDRNDIFAPTDTRRSFEHCICAFERLTANAGHTDHAMTLRSHSALSVRVLDMFI